MPLLVALSEDRQTRRCSRGQSPQARPQGSGGSSPASSQHPEPTGLPHSPRERATEPQHTTRESRAPRGCLPWSSDTATQSPAKPESHRSPMRSYSGDRGGLHPTLLPTALRTSPEPRGPGLTACAGTNCVQPGKAAR